MKRLTLPLLLCPLILNAEPSIKQIGGDFKRPIHVTSRPNDANLLFVVEQAGKVILHDQAKNKTLNTPFLDITADVSRKHNEEGLLGFTLSPDYAQSGRVYANFSNAKRTNEIVRYTVKNPAEDLVCDPDTKEILLTYKQPHGNHNGGYLEFGPDGLLYIGTGDGGSANDPGDNAQDLTNLLGKILRIDVSPSEGYLIPEDNPFAESESPEILAYGLRNPWRCCWDGDHFYIADVGQNAWEEVNVVTSKQLNGANFGWRPREGFHETPKKGVGGPMKSEYTDPVVEYKHNMESDGGLSINGGYVYRGSVKELQGKYLYSDHVNPRIWSFEFAGGKATNQQDLSEILSRPDDLEFRQLSAFGQDADKEVYIIEMGDGAIWKILE
ncbi:MAG: PQQ-dependent sugar dehydrogenase [Roseibacillus sp.]